MLMTTSHPHGYFSVCVSTGFDNVKGGLYSYYDVTWSIWTSEGIWSTPESGHPVNSKHWRQYHAITQLHINVTTQNEPTTQWFNTTWTTLARQFAPLISLTEHRSFWT